MNWIVTQIGNREHYACPLGFHRHGTLGRLYTDIWAGPMLRAVARKVKPLGALAGRYNAQLPAEKVVGFNWDGIRWTQKLKRANGAGVAVQHRCYDEIGSWFASAVVRHLARNPLDPKRHVLYAFSTGALETVRYARSIGMPAIVNQLDPARVDQQMISEEQARWPGWQATEGEIPESYFERLSGEWEAAGLVVVNSEFSKRALVSQGVPAGKIFVVPLAYTPEVKAQTDRSGRTSREPLKVIWLGQIVLRKGIPYLFEAARILAERGVPVEIKVAGTVGISKEAIAKAPANVKVLGRVPREEALGLYADADCFVLPTISDGFAITQIEAMSYGLPVIVTPNCGDVVSEGEDGFIIPIRDPESLADRIAALANDRDRLRAMSAKAVVKSQQFTLERYTTAIETVARGLVGPG